MIKDLIKDLAFNQINLSQALTRAKLIAYNSQNTAFKDWIILELNGYKNGDQLPDYRKIPCQTEFVIAYPHFGVHTTSIANDEPDVSQYYNFHNVHESVIEIESALLDHSDKLNITLQLPPNLAYLLYKPYKRQIEAERGSIQSVRQKFAKAPYAHVVELTKQKLLDTLLELNDQFPDFDNEFKATKENLNKVENIVTNHIYGNNNPVNVAAGNTVTQKDITTNIGVTDYSKLESLGVQKGEIEELQTIVETNKGDKSKLKEKAMKWVIPVVTNVTARGLYDNTPKIMEFVTQLIENLST